ncbi:MAG TPA: septum site-determining protein MinC [Quisquiliibacterium sp.]|nr:septum site-determining protein MinC [Quisquiliibacterium sp.]
MRPDSSDQTVPAPTAEAAAAPARPAIEFKGISHPSLRAVIHDASAEALHASVRQLLEDDPERFEWQPVVIDLVRVGSQAPIDWPGLLSALRVLRLNPVAVAGAAEAFRDEAARLQLGWLAPLPEPRRRVQPIPLPVNAPAAEAAAASGASAPAAPPTEVPTGPAQPAGSTAERAEAVPAAAAAPAPSAPAPAPAPSAQSAPAADTMIVDRPVRSGQRVYARGGDLVVIGSVSPGAEVIADGNVHVYGELRGRAIAGARGRRDASIFALDMRAELVAVCGVYRTFEDEPSPDLVGRPVRIELDANADTLSLRAL